MQQSISVPNVEELFFAALELEGPEARAAFLDQVCADPELRRRVERLLALDPEANDYLEAPATMPTATATDDSRSTIEEPGTAIGPYRLLEVIGEGGMGTVSMAEQTEPVRRRVALKVIKPGMDSKQVVARFEAERQALAMMDHPNIARVFDGGMTPSGRPFFVMELVRGLPITEYCDRHQLSIPERLELFVLVCRAVQHAHQKGIIHRDIKPSNVLVTVIDGVAVPKVIDFGVAKATGQALTDKTLVTGFHQFVGTPLYVSPEQAELCGVDVDTRSDIYSLGVLLYELLTGTTPFDSETLRRATFDEMRRILREEEPPRPSTRLSSLGERLSTVSASRKADPRQLGTSMKGELDWVVMKALEKDRRRRYETASDFAADVMRYLTDRPVEAHPPTAGYRFSKFAHRNRVALTIGAIAGSVLILGVVGLMAALFAITREQSKTAKALETAELRRTEAEGQRRVARQAVDEMYTEVAEKWLSQEPELTPLQREFLEKALTFYERFADRMGTDIDSREKAAGAALRVGDIRAKLGKLEQKIGPYRQGMSIVEKLADENPDRGEFREWLAIIHNGLAVALQGLGRLDEAEKESRAAIASIERLLAKEPSSTSYRNQLAMWQINLGATLLMHGRGDEAEEVLQGCCDNFERLAADNTEEGAYSHNRAVALANLADVWADAGRHDKAEKGFKEAIWIHQSECPEPDKMGCSNFAARSLMRLSQLYKKLDRLQNASDAARRAVALWDELDVTEPDDSYYMRVRVQARRELASYLSGLGKSSEAEDVLRFAIAEAEKAVALFPEKLTFRDEVVNCSYDLAWSLTDRGAFLEAVQPFETSLSHLEGLVEDHPDRADLRKALTLRMALLADHYAIRLESENRNPRRALELAEKSVELSPGEDGIAWQSLGWARYRAGDWKGSLEALEKQQSYLTHGDFIGAMAHWQLGDEAEARAVFDRADRWLARYETRTDSYPPGSMFRRIRDEAASFLGIEPPSGEAPPPHGPAPGDL